MAPKPAAKPTTTTGKKPSGAGKKADSKADAVVSSVDDSAAPTTMAAPKNKEEVLAQVNLDNLPNCPAEQIIEILRTKYDNLVYVFINYCKHSECKTMEMSTRLKLGACARCGGGRRTAAHERDAAAASRTLVAHARSSRARVAAPLAAPSSLPAPARPVVAHPPTPLPHHLLRPQLASSASCATPTWRSPCTTLS